MKKTIYTKETISESVRFLLKKYHAEKAILFGSYARGDAEEDSDIDVMILLDASREEIAARNWETCDIAADLSIDYDVIISPVVENRAFFRHWVRNLPFFRNVEQEGVMLCG